MDKCEKEDLVKRLLGFFGLLLLAGCAATAPLASFSPPLLKRQAPEEQLPREPIVNIEDGLTLEEAITLAMAQNPDLRAVQRGLPLSQARRITAGQWPANPVLDLGSDSALPIERGEDYAFRLGVSQEFELGGKRARRLEVAQANIERTKAAIANAQRIIHAEVALTFHEFLTLEELVSIATRNVEIASELRETAQARFEAKQIPELELNLVRLQYQRTRNESRRAASRQQAARLRLTALLGLESNSEFRPIGVLRSSAQQITPEEAFGIAEKRRPDLLALEARLRMAAAQVGLERARVWPNPELGLFYERQAEFIDTLSARDHVLGLELSIPIPVLTRRKGQIAEAEAELSILEADLLGFRRQIARDIDLTLNRLALAGESVTLYEQELNRLSLENLQALERAYRAGEVGTLQVLRAQEDHNRVSAGYQAALFEQTSAGIQLESALGGNRFPHRTFRGDN